MQQRALMSSDEQKCCCVRKVEALQGKRNSCPPWCPFSFLAFITQECVQRNGAIHRMTGAIYIVWFSFPAYPVHVRCCCHVKQPQPLGLFCCCWQLADFIFVWRCFLPNYPSLLSSVCLVTSLTSMMPRSMVHCFTSFFWTGWPVKMIGQCFFSWVKGICALSHRSWLNFLTGSAASLWSLDTQFCLLE